MSRESPGKTGADGRFSPGVAPAVAHALPGRVRIRFQPLGDPRLDVSAWAAAIAALPGVRDVAVKRAARSVVIRFEPDRVGTSELLDRTASTPLRFARAEYGLPYPSELEPSRRALATLAVAGGVAASKAAAGPSAFAVTPTSFGLTTASTLVNNYPFLRRPASTLASRAGLPPQTALWAGALVALALRQNLLGLGVLLAGQCVAGIRRAAERRVAFEASTDDEFSHADPGPGHTYSSRAQSLALTAAAVSTLSGDLGRPVAALLGACPSAVHVGRQAPAAFALSAAPPSTRIGSEAALAAAGRATSLMWADWAAVGRFRVGPVRVCAAGFDRDQVLELLRSARVEDEPAPWWAEAVSTGPGGASPSRRPASGGLTASAGEPGRLRRQGHRLGPAKGLCERERQEGRVPICLIVEGTPAAVVGLEPEPFPGALRAVAELVGLGLTDIRIGGPRAAAAAMERSLGLRRRRPGRTSVGAAPRMALSRADSGGGLAAADIVVVTAPEASRLQSDLRDQTLVVRMDRSKGHPIAAMVAAVDSLAGLVELIALGRRYRRAARECDAVVAGLGLTGLGLAAAGSIGAGTASILNNVAALAAVTIAGRHFASLGRTHRSTPWEAIAEVAATGATDLPIPPPNGSVVIPLRPWLDFHISGGEGGLSEADAAGRLARFGPNRLPAGNGYSFWRKLGEQFKDLSTWLLFAATGASWALGSRSGAFLILAILALNAGLGAIQDARAERFARQVRRLGAPVARVQRDGVVRAINAEEVVPGDLLILEAGDRVPADARLVWGTGVAVEESALTGESAPVEKTVGTDADQLYLGTTVVRGRARALVFATGPGTELGQLARSLHSAIPPSTPLQNRLGALGGMLSWTALFLCAGVGALGLLRGEPLTAILATAVSLAVAAIPEGLPAVVTVNLALGVQALSGRNAIVRNLPAVENLGAASAVCCDKTGTLTFNRLAVRAFWTPAAGHVDVPAPGPWLTEVAGVAECLQIGALCNNAELSWRGNGGDPTEQALLQAAVHAGIDLDELSLRFCREREYPFDSERRRMTVLCRNGSGATLFGKGALDAILPLCDPTPDEDRLWQAHDELTRDGLRVLALAQRVVPREAGAESDRLEECGFEFAGLVGLLDPPRPDVAPAVKRLHAGGIAVLLLTGDHPGTAVSVAREVGVFRPGDRVVSGSQVAACPDEDLPDLIAGATVFARLLPADKLRIVRALQRDGHVVAMVGDGVNDAPAIRAADIGVSMGTTGTDLAKGAADLILTDDRLATVVTAVEQGRSTYLNIRRSVRYLLATNAAEVLLMAAAVAIGLPMPLLPAQLLLINLVGDGLPVLALAAEPPHPGAMAAPPRARSEGFFAGGAGRRIAGDALSMGFAAVGVYFALLRLGRPLAVARTTALASLSISQVRYALRCRERDSAAGNPLLTGATALSGVALGASVHLPVLQNAFGTVALGPAEWAAAALASWAGLRPRSDHCNFLAPRRTGARRGGSAPAISAAVSPAPP